MALTLRPWLGSRHQGAGMGISTVAESDECMNYQDLTRGRTDRFSKCQNETACQICTYERSLSSKVIVWIRRQANTGVTTQSGPLKWSVINHMIIKVVRVEMSMTIGLIGL